MTLSFMACGLLLVAGAVAAQAQAPGTASGTLTVNGKDTALHYAYAFQRENPFETGQQQIVVLLSDVPIGVLDRQDPFALQELGADGKLAAVQVEFDLNGKITNGSLYHAAVGNASVTRSGNDFFDKKVFSTKHVEGKLYMKEASELDDMVHQYSATFAADVEGKPKPTAEGAAAAASEPGKLALAFIKAVVAKDDAAIKALMSPKGQAIFAQYRDMFYQTAGEAYKTTTKITRVFEYDDKAIAETDIVSDGQALPIKFVRVEGAWKITN